MFLQEKVNDINKSLEALKNFSNVVIWGAGMHTCKLFEKTDLLSYNIKDIVDMDEKKQGSHYFGYIIKSPEEIAWNTVDAIVISVPNRESEIAETLVDKWGASGKIITLYKRNECTPFYLLYDEKIPAIRYLGDYDSWDDAYKECNGYEDENIINTVSSAIKKVLDGEAVWERDGYLFYEQKFVYRICAAILKCALQNKNQGVCVLDIGGSLGSTYFQNRNYLDVVKDLKYIIAEQDHFADYGHNNLENGVLKFIRSADSWEDYGKFDIVLMSASLQYISNYKEIIHEIMRMKPRYIIIDRLMVSDRIRICMETVPEEIYKSSYPITVFSEAEVEKFFAPDYKMIEKDFSSVPEAAYFADGKAVSMYYVFKSTVEEKDEG